MTAPPTPDTPAAGAPAAPTQPPQSRTAEVIAQARERLVGGGSILDADAGRDVAAPTAPAAGSGASPPEALTVTLPGMEERGEQPLEIEAPDRETYERLSRIQQEATVGRQVKHERGEIQRSQTELRELEDKIATDPAGFALEQLPEATRTEIAMQLFFEPGVLDAIQAKLREAGVEGGIADVLESPDALRTLRAELKASRLEMRDTLHQRRQVETAMQTNARAIIAEVERLVPRYVADEQRARVVQDAVRDLSDRARRLGLTELDPRDVAPLIAQRLRALGSMTARRSSAPPAAPSRAARPAAPAGELPKGTEARLKLARQVGLAELVKRARAEP